MHACHSNSSLDIACALRFLLKYLAKSNRRTSLYISRILRVTQTYLRPGSIINFNKFLLHILRYISNEINQKLGRTIERFPRKTPNVNFANSILKVSSICDFKPRHKSASKVQLELIRFKASHWYVMIFLIRKCVIIKIVCQPRETSNITVCILQYDTAPYHARNATISSR